MKQILILLAAVSIFVVCMPLIGYAIVLSALPGQFPYALMMASGIAAILAIIPRLFEEAFKEEVQMG